MRERGQLNNTKESKTNGSITGSIRGDSGRPRASRRRTPPVQPSQVHPRAEWADLKKMGKKGAVSGPGTIPSTGNRQDFI